MRIPRSWVPPMARKVADTLLAEELVLTEADPAELARAIEEIIVEELSVEDRINEEVRQILRQYEGEIDRGKLNYRSLFELTKKKIVKERNVII